jgi:hypothetical protein
MSLTAFRFVFKPLMELLGGAVKVIPTLKDDEFYSKVIENKFYKGFVIDWIASIKLLK